MNAKPNSNTTLESVVVNADAYETPLSMQDEIVASPLRSKLEKPSSDVSLSESVSKLPGTLVRSTSGVKSLTTVLTPRTLTSGGLHVFIDGIRLPDPNGLGIDLSLLEPSFFSSAEFQSPFFEDSFGESRIQFESSSPKNRLAAGVMFGTADSFSGSALTAPIKNGAHEVLFGISAFNTSGDFKFKSPETGQMAKRENNSSTQFGNLARYKYRKSEKLSLNLVQMYSQTERTNPGSLDWPSRDHERDQFFLTGMSAVAKEAAMKAHTFDANVSFVSKRTLLEQSSNNSLSFRSLGIQGAASSRFELGSKHWVRFSLSNDNDAYKTDFKNFERQLLGISTNARFDLGLISILPGYRHRFGFQTNGGNDAKITFEKKIDLTDFSAAQFDLSAGYFESYPAIDAIAGYENSFGKILPNPTLKMQKDLSLELASSIEASDFSRTSVVGFLSQIHDRATLVSQSPVTSQYVNSNRVNVIGTSIDQRFFIGTGLELRTSLTLADARETEFNHEMPYKPRFESLVAVSWLTSKNLRLTAENQSVGKRFIDSTTEQTVSPTSTFNLRVDYSTTLGLVYAKVSNVFSASGYEYPGYPIIGRSVWLGYQHGK